MVVNKQKESAAIRESIKEYLCKLNINVFVLYTGQNSNILENPGKLDLAISLGGDGTVLSAARFLAEYGIPIIPINLGTFGFITEVLQTEWLSAFKEYCAGLLSISKRVMLNISVRRNGQLIQEFQGLNDLNINDE